MVAKYSTDPKEVYTLELNKLQRCFSEVTKIVASAAHAADIADGGMTPPRLKEASEVSRVTWRQVEYLRHMTFMLESAKEVGERIVEKKVNKG
jgi:hypothetical protein